MNKPASQVTVSVEDLTLKTKTIPQMTVLISGTPNLAQISNLMKTINAEAAKIQGDYVAITDLSNLKINEFFKTLILFGMEKTYKLFLSVNHPSILSFVILGKDSAQNSRAKRSLQEINEADANKKYYYNYVFISDSKDVKKITEEYLLKN